MHTGQTSLQLGIELEIKFIEKTGQTVGIRCRAQPDNHADKHPAYRQLVPFNPFFPHLYLPKSTPLPVPLVPE